MTPTPEILRAAAADLPAILDLLERSGLPVTGLVDHAATIVVARAGDRVVGCAALELYGEAALLRSVAVDEPLRGTGLGGALTRAAVDLGRARGVRSLYLLTETAGGFFPRFGFRAVDRADVDPAVRRSVEFTTACPVSALAMMLELRS